MFGLKNPFNNIITEGFLQRNTVVDIFHEVVGYGDLKQLLNLALSSQESIAILLSGNPGNGKSTFLRHIESAYKRHSLYLDCTMMTKAGFFSFLSINPKVKILLLDEISRLKNTDQEIMLNLLQYGHIIDTKYKRHNELKFNSLKVFATCNDAKKLISPLRDRFDEYRLPDYTYEEFNSIGFRVIKQKDPRLKQLIVDLIWNDLGSKSIRDLVNVSKYINNQEDLVNYIKIKKKYLP